RRTRLSNLFLLPGSHYAAVSGPRGGDYTLRVLPIGPPDPLMEREPNDDPSRSHRLDFGATRRGLLDEANDRDAYRFHLGAPDHIRITLTPPADGTVAAALDYEGRGLKQSQGVSGDPLVLEGLFPPGDYGLTLSVEKPSDGEYTLRLERLDRFACPVDCEPNDSESFANPLPADRVLTGSIGPWREWDVFALPAAPEPRALVVSGELSGIDFRLKVDGIWPRLEWDRQAGEVRGEVPADTPAYLEVGGKGSYRLQVRLDPEPAPAPPPGELPVDVAVELETDTVAAFRRLGQLVGGRVLLTHRGDRPRRVALDAATSQYGWEVAWQGDPDHGAAPSPPASGATAGSPPSRSPAIDVPAGGSASVGFTLHVPADAWADVPVRVSVRAADATGAAAGWAEATPGRETRPVAPRRAWEVPDALLGGLNVAWSALGAERVGGEDLQNGRVCRGADYLFDELTTIGEGFVCRGNRPDEAIEVTIDLAGDQPVAVAGFALHPQSESTALHRARDYLLSLSLDGREWREVARGELSPLPVQQAIPLAAPVPARFARLRLGHNHGGDHAIQLGEWKVLAAPGTPVPGAPPNLADPALGGHVVWSQPRIDAFWGVHVLTEKAETPTVRLREEERGEWVLGFHHDRAAQIAGIEWVAWQREHALAFAEVSLAVSVDSPLGPWEPLGSWQVAPTGTTTIALPEPAWARFLKLSAESRGAATAYPETIRVFERPTDASYRSILGAWGHRSGDGPWEAAQAAAVEETVTVAGNRSRATAHLLPLGRPVQGRVRLGHGAAWYGVVVPPGHNTLQVRLAGDPGVRVVARLETASGERVPLREIDIAPSQHLFEAVVEPAGEYYLAVEEPPRSVIFSWDTSASVNPYIQLIYSSLAAFAEDVQPGREEVNLLPFGGRLLLADWSGHPYVLRTALNEYPRNDNSSSAERTLAQASEALAGRAGTRAVVLVTDAATPPYPAVWSALREGRPRIFGLGISVQKAFEQGLMEDWSRVDAGEFHQLTTVGAMERGFDRAVTLLRRPADYTLEVTSRFEEAPGPGTLAVVAKEGEGEPTGPAVELILDASGSMLQRMADGRRRIEVAREVLTRVVTERLPPGTPLALRVFGHRQANACRTDLEVPLAPLDPAAVSRTIAGIQAKNLAKTPIADSLAAVEKDLAKAPGQKLVVLVTDGEETCDGKPEEVLAGLRDKGFAVTVNVVGFAIDDPELERTFADWAAEGGGRYFSARDREGLDAAVAQALEVPFAVYDSGGTRVAEGVVGGAPVELEAGVYRVEVATEPPRSFEEVEVPGEEQVTLEIGGGG
ncbi:MAG TPA: VWA domain-containing protein, partial [Thermoanaerobaculia bacterium]|nr:VWA domain-containing protein [Thermoanaerobaculia bacterium]